MKMTYDKKANALYVRLVDGAIETSERIADGIVFDFNQAGGLVGIEVLDASERFDVKALLAADAIERKNITATHSQWDEIDRAAKAAGMTRSAFLIHAATERATSAALTAGKQARQSQRISRR